MKDLIALVELVSKNKIKEVEILSNSSNSQTKIQRLYNGIHYGEIKSDEDIVEKLFPDNKNANLYSSRLKSQLRERLINTLFFVDINQANTNSYSNAYYSAYKIAAATRILLGKGARTAAVPLAEKGLELAMQFDLTDVALILARDLRTNYGKMRGAKNHYEELNRIVEEQTDILVAELKAEKYLNNLMVELANIKATKPEFAKNANQYAKELKNLAKTIKSYRFNYITFIIRALEFEVAGDYSNMLIVCREALEYFLEKGTMVPITVLISFYIRTIICLIQLKKYKEAETIIPKCIAISQVGGYNWFLVLNYYMILAFHSANFQKAYDVGQEALNHSKFKNQNEQTVEFWRIHEAYLFYLITIKKITPDEKNPVKKFRLNKFLNEVPMHRKDKTGANITIIVLQILFLLEQKKYDIIIDRIESLKTYTQRYLRNDETFRSNCFIRMLVVMAESSFNKRATIRKAEKYWEKLKEKPINIAAQSPEIELIPYEMLWEFVLESLDEKWH